MPVASGRHKIHVVSRLLKRLKAVVNARVFIYRRNKVQLSIAFWPISNGDNLSLSINLGGDEDSSDKIYLDKAYVRKEDGKSYVMKDDGTGHLVKQYVKTGKTIYGYAVEIKSGVTMDDYLAFPYGKTAKEGVKTNKDEDSGTEMY